MFFSTYKQTSDEIYSTRVKAFPYVFHMLTLSSAVSPSQTYERHNAEKNNGQTRAEIWLSGDQLTTYSDPSRNWTYCLQVRPAESQTIIFSVFCLFVFCFVLFCFTFWPHHGACGILVPRPGIKPMSPAFESWSLNHWTTREVSGPLSSDMSIQEGEE